jgi:hypothetical protein
MAKERQADRRRPSGNPDGRSAEDREKPRGSTQKDQARQGQQSGNRPGGGQPEGQGEGNRKGL